jgi:PAS domain S-box-containing protein
VKAHVRYFIAGIIILAVGLLAVVFTQRRDFAEHQYFDAELDRLGNLDAGLSENVLRARFRLLSDYDGFFTQIEALKETAARLSVTPSFVPETGKKAFLEKLNELALLHAEKEQLIERFKSENAVLNNSLRYLPKANSELLKELTQSEEGRAVDASMRLLMQSILMHCLQPGEDGAAEVRRALAQIAEWSAEHPDHPQTAALAGLAAHVRSIITRKPKIERLTEEIVSMPTALRAEELLHIYERELSGVLHRSDQRQRILGGLCALLLLGIGYTLYALVAANRHLERRVIDRTAALQEEVAERKSAEERLKESLRSLAAINAVLDRSCIIETTDRNGNITHANDNCCHITEYSREELLGQGHRILKSDEHSDSFFQELWHTISRGGIWRGEVKNRSKSGRLYWVDTTIGPLLDEEGKPSGYLAIRTDITERKRVQAEAEEMNKQLIETSRHAGMAEVATGVLHNVGNVLNSVNVSATLIAEGVRKSKIGNLARVVTLLDDHAANLGAFVTSDAQGKNLTGYLRQLHERLVKEQGTILVEMVTLRDNIDHIKDIVAMQQEYAKVSGVTEVLEVSSLVEDSLRMNAAGLSRHGVTVERDFQEVPRVATEKHKVLQILVNLIRNAKYACDEGGREDKRLTLRVRNEDGRVRISVSDNGVGIPPENLARIFNHGFTTRKEGHGFGLHSGALAATEMGGSLRVHSEGLGCGATFTLELPLEGNPNN